ncbi:hypothetical protein THOG05_60200 [Vibrio rotiferianus]|nr:hypothetical protein THOG05_60200 [Vibrio rotiferianus]CAH1564070.1 hypothetical protein THOE12_20662 [Vibrio rotiferianus]
MNPLALHRVSELNSMIGMIAIKSGKSILGKKRLFIFYNLKTPQAGRKQPELSELKLFRC